MRLLHLITLAVLGATAAQATSNPSPASSNVLARRHDDDAALKRQLVTPSSDQLEADIQEWAEEIAEDEDAYEEEMLKEEFPSLFDGDDIDESLDDEFTEWDSDVAGDGGGDNIVDDDYDGYHELVAASKNGTRIIGKHGRATIISTPVLTALLITLLIVLPVLFCGISALASIQVSRRSPGKGTLANAYRLVARRSHRTSCQRQSYLPSRKTERSNRRRGGSF